MATCKNCGNHFPNRLWVNERLIHLASRKYCLTCSPFGKHNTRKIERGVPPAGTPVQKACVICGDSFVTKNRASRCGSCRKNRRVEFNRKNAYDILGRTCQICGYGRCLKSLSFHHVDPSAKKFNLSAGWHLGWPQIFTELYKCVHVCHNCHEEIHSGLIEPKKVSDLLSCNQGLLDVFGFQERMPIKKAKVIKCSHCGIEFKKTNVNRKFCSIGCSVLENKEVGALSRKVPRPSLEELEYKRKLGISWRQLSKEYGVSPSAVRKWIVDK